MAVRDTFHSVISPTDLRNCTGAREVFDLFRKLRLPVPAGPPVSVPLEQDDLPGSLREGVADRYLVARIAGARPGDPSVDITLFVLADAQRKSALVRGIAANWTRRYPGNHLVVFATRDGGTGHFGQLTFVNSERLGEGAQVRVKLRKLIVERTHPTRHDADILNHIALASPGVGADAAYKAQVEAFNVERMTGAFYRGYADLFKKAFERIRVDNPGIQDFYEPSRLHAFTQRLFGRVMFLYFLQKKRSLDDNLNFIEQHYLDTVRRNENFYRFVLEPLFFETLNRPREGARSPRFGRIPYLNGGLFAPDELDHVGDVYLSDDLFDAKGEGGILYFLNNHNFTVEEDTPLEVEVALDPEMLGKVFENLLEAEERGKSGTFYTPRPVVAFMCREALAAYLAREAGATPDALGWLLDEAETGEPPRDDQGDPRLTHHTLPRHLRERVERALESVRVLDPAVGSGAFPLGMLTLLVGVRRALYRIGGATFDPQSHIVEGWKRNFIRDCLYGVDKNREAIEIARLRLWLSLVVDADPFDMEPLPNLDYKVMVGDSLIETFDGVAIYPTRPEDAPAQQTLLGGDETRRLVKQLREVQSSYFQPEAMADRATLKQRIRETEYALVEQALRDRREDERIRLENVLQRLANLAGKAAPAALAAEQQELTHSIEVTDQALRDLKAGKPLPFFLYRLHFASVFAEKDGFDIVIANPPYVRHEKIAPTTLLALKAAYPDVAHGMADLYVYFYARALQLLHDGGTLCVISSNKFFRAGYGKGLRTAITTRTRVRTVIDFGDFPVFDATAYPCIVIAGSGKPDFSHTYRGLTAGPDLELDKLGQTLAAEGQSLSQCAGVKPPSGASASSELVDRLMEMGIPLGKVTGSKPYYGIKTGLNHAFVITAETRARLIAEHESSALIIKPFLRGRDIDRYSIRPSELWLIFTRQGIDITSYPAIKRHLEQFRHDLEPKRKPGDGGPGRKPGPYKWYEIQDAVEYHRFFDEPKIVYPDIAVRGEFALDTSGAYFGNTTYFVPTPNRHLCALLNSKLLGYLYSWLSPQLRGGYFRYFSEYVARLPIVEPSLADQRRLSDVVDRLQALGGAGPEAEALEREVDDIVYRTYGLTADEIKIIEDWHAERRAQLGEGGKSRGFALGKPALLGDDDE